ncbi:SusC/RagA family TonB-linked outer membrane protein [Sphingobacterium sp. Mn56C]|uniref:SusC/RagA family TonB-linked outer membrane protein n=1 Tax=Sphingobacterium sp. Mn56C TaxID=3395261 RepID=UPI003BCA4FDF
MFQKFILGVGFGISLLLGAVNTIFGQQRGGSVQGIVTDVEGKAIAYVNISVKDRTGAVLFKTTTDTAGKFKLSELPVAIYSFTFTNISYFRKQVTGVDVKAGATNNLIVNLRLKSQEIADVVVVGYGTQRKSDVTGAISSVAATLLKEQPVVNVQSALQGKTSAVQITQNSGSPGSIAQVRIRGLTSINNADPLYVVDGIPLASNAINSIDPASIASVDILKDASAQAIYGSRGANGVLLIKTKSGTDGPAQITFSTFQGLSKVRKLLDMVSASDYIALHEEAYNNAGQQSPFTKPASAYTETTNWQRELFRTAHMQNYNVALAGGSQQLTYRVSGAYLGQDGTLRGSDYRRLNIANTLNLKPKSYLEFGETLTLNRSVTHRVATDFGANVINDAMAMDPTIPVRDKEGNFTATEYSDIVNPLAKIHYLYSHWPTTAWGLLGNVFMQVKPWAGLRLKSSYSVDLKFSDYKQFTPTYQVAPNFNNPVSRMYQQKDLVNSWTWDNTATYDFVLAARHQFTVLAGVSAQRYSFDNLYGANQGQPGNAPYLHYLDAGISGQQVGGRQQNWSLLSYMARVNYNLEDSYFATLTIRRDGSSKFGANYRYGNFPSASVGWNLKKASFLSDVEQVNAFKIRGSWGIVGNQASVGYYDYAAGIQNAYYAIGLPAVAQPTGEPYSLANPNLRWEQVQQWNVGFDYALLKDRLTGTIDYYEKRTVDMLMRLNIPAISGYTESPRQNAGTMKNSGLEFSMNFMDSPSHHFSWNIGVHFATIKNRIEKVMWEGQHIYSGNIKPGQTQLTRVGLPVASFYGYVTDGIFQNQQEIDGAAKQNPGTAPGDIRFKDLNNDGVIDEKDQQFLGSPIPKLTYGFNLGATFKGFDFSAFFNGVYGNKVLAAYQYYTHGFFISNYNLERAALGRWTGPGTSNTMPRLTASDPNNNSRVSDYYLQRGSFLRLQNLTLGYTLKSGAIKGLKDTRFYVSAQNLLTITRYTGYDPEVGQQYSGSGGTLDMGIDNGNYPQSKTVAVGVNISF